MVINKEFLESTETSKRIREIGVKILNRVSQLMILDPETDSNEVSRINSELEMLEGEFISLGIQRDMNTGKTKNEYEASPIVTMQWIAGQIYHFYIIPIPSEDEVIGPLGEFNLIDRSTDYAPYLTEGKQTPKIVVDFMRAQSMLTGLEYFIDLQPTEKNI